MKFEDLRYVERIDKYGKTLCLSLPGCFPVFKSTVVLAWRSVHENWANIDWTRRQSAETMIGSAVWQTQVHGAKLALGRCIRFFVTHGMLPLPLALANTRWGTPYRGGKRLYVLADTVIVNPLPVVAMPANLAARNREWLARVDWAALGRAIPPTTTGKALPCQP